jgi:hypothetical protein
MPDFFVNILLSRNGLANLFAKELAETFSQAMHFHPQGGFAPAKLRG